MDDNYKKREIDVFVKHIKEKLDSIENLATNTNGKVRMHTKLFIGLGAVTGTLLVTNGSELIKIFKLII